VHQVGNQYTAVLQFVHCSSPCVSEKSTKINQNSFTVVFQTTE